jgi:hypothetical protein
MGYYMRFLDTSEKPLAIDEIEGAMRNVDPAYRLEAPESARMIPQADLNLGDGLYAEIEINQPGDGLFEDEIAEMLEFLEDAEGKGRKRVEVVLKGARRIVSVRVLGQGRQTEETLAGIDPLWKWLFSTRDGLLQADGEGYYDADDLILEESW